MGEIGGYMNTSFGEYVKSCRNKLGKTLRDFCLSNRYDVGYISRVENDLFPAPKGINNQIRLANALKIKKGTPAWIKFFDLAATSLKQIPSDIALDNPKLLNYLPAFMRKANKTDLTPKDVEEFLKLVKGV